VFGPIFDEPESDPVDCLSFDCERTSFSQPELDGTEAAPDFHGSYYLNNLSIYYKTNLFFLEFNAYGSSSHAPEHVSPGPMFQPSESYTQGPKQCNTLQNSINMKGTTATAVPVILTSSTSPRFLLYDPIVWGTKHPDFDKGKDKRARWSDEELIYLRNLIVSLSQKDNCIR